MAQGFTLLDLPRYAVPQPLDLSPLQQAIQFAARQQQAAIENERAAQKLKLDQNQDERAGRMAPIQEASVRANTESTLGANRRAETMLPEEIAARRAATGASNASAGLATAQATAVRGQEGRAAAMGPVQLAEAEARARAAKYQSFDPDKPIGRIGKDGTMEWVPQPEGARPKLSDGDRKAVREAEKELAGYDVAISQLNKALQLNPIAGSGYGTSTAAALRNKSPGAVLSNPQSRAAAELENILSTEAIKSMSETLKGASTDREMFKFIELAGDVSLDPKVRDQYLRAAIKKMDAYRAVAAKQADEIRTGNYYKPPTAPAAAPQATEPAGSWSIRRLD